MGITEEDKMKVKNLIKRLKRLDKNKNIIFGNDSELNYLFDNVFIANLEKADYVIYPDELTETVV